MTTVEQHTCTVCGASEKNPRLLSECTACGTLFHFNPRSDIEGIDCGDVWVGDGDAPGLHFFCNPCIARFREQARELQSSAPAGSTLGIDPLAAFPGFGPPAGLSAPQASISSECEAPAESPAAPAPDHPRRRFRRIDTH